MLGREVVVPVEKSLDKWDFNTSALSPGVYLVTIDLNGNKTTKKIVIN
jgi:hypothetical protein